MKKFIYSFMALVLAFSLAGFAAPAPSPFVIEAEAQTATTWEVWETEFAQSGNGTAGWSDGQSTTGPTSALLEVPDGGDSARVKVNFPLEPIVFNSINGSDPDQANFWGYVDSFGGSSGLGAQLYMIVYCDNGTDGVYDYALVANGSVNMTDGTPPESHVGEWVQYQPTDFGNITWLLSADAHGQAGWVYNDTWDGYIANGFGGDDIIGVAVGLMNTYGAADVYIDDITLGTTATTFDLGTIQDAIDAANPGDTVIVHPGTYEEKGIPINKSLTVESESGDWHDTIIDPLGGYVIYIGPNFTGHATISGLTITGGTIAGIYVDGLAHGGTVDITDCFIYNNGTGIRGDGDLDGGITVDDCIITENGEESDGISLNRVEGTVEVTDSVIGGYWDAVAEEDYSGNSGDGIKIKEITQTGNVLIDNNKIVDNERHGIHVVGPDTVKGTLTITDNIIGGYDYDLGSVDGDFGGNTDGIHIARVSPTGVVTIDGNWIADNSNKGIDFGGSQNVEGTVVINDNRIGAWTQADGENPDYTHYGNGIEGIFVYKVDSYASMTITNNQIAENYVDTGIVIRETRGNTTISGNHVGSWTQTHFGDVPLEESVTYEGNWGPGIEIKDVPGGSLTIGPDNTIAKNTNCGIYVRRNHNGQGEVTIEGNVIDDNGTGGEGIYLERVDYATVDGNTITKHIEDTCMLAGIWLNDSDCNAIINNTITDNYIGVYIGEDCEGNGIVGNVISDNALDGILVEGEHNNILRNVISGNTGAVGDHYCGVFICNGAGDNVIYYNNITENTDDDSYGVFHDGEEDVDARWNWWGDDTGPYHGGTNPGGEGDAVSSYVDYSEWTDLEYDYDPEDMPWDTEGPRIDTAVAVPDMLSVYSALSEISESSWTADTPFSPGPFRGRYYVITSDVGTESEPRGVRYVTLDLKDAVEQLLGGTSLEDIEEIPPWFIQDVEQWGQLKLCEEEEWNRGFCCGHTVWFTGTAFGWTLEQLLGFFEGDEEHFFLMLQPGEIEVPVTVTDYSGNENETTIEIAIVDEQLALGEGWNLRSTPINLGINSWEEIIALGDGLDYGTAIRWNSELQTWEELLGDDMLMPLDAIAIKANSFDSLGLVFDRNTTAAPSLELYDGWNLVGLAVSPPRDPWMPVNDALISVEEILDGTRGYIIADSPRQYVEVDKEYWWECCEEWPEPVYNYLTYGWYFGQEDWEFLHHGEEAVPPIPDMTIGGGYWVFMERDDTLAGFSNTPVFLSLELEQREDLACIPRYPGTTMVGYEDSMDEEACYEAPSCWAGLQWARIDYKGEFTLDKVFSFYEEEMPKVCGWQLGRKGIWYMEDGDAAGYIGFWKEGEFAGVPYYTMMGGALIDVNADGPDNLRIYYQPVDVPTCPGTSLIAWETLLDWPCPLCLEFKGAIDSVEQAIPMPSGEFQLLVSDNVTITTDNVTTDNVTVVTYTFTYDFIIEGEGDIEPGWRVVTVESGMEKAIQFYMQAMSELQWELVPEGCECDCDKTSHGYVCTQCHMMFFKPQAYCGFEPLICDIDIEWCPEFDIVIVNICRDTIGY